MQVQMTVHGRVQGVNFRNTVKRQADKLGIAGWVRNEPEGTVTIVAQGDQKLLKEFQKWLKDSPGLSGVRQLIIQEMDEQRFSTFTVKRRDFFGDQVQSFRNLGRSL